MNVKVIKEVGIATITSALKFEVIAALEAQAPQTLVTKDEEGNETFRIATGEYGEVKPYCIVYSGKNAEGFATVRYSIPEGVEDVAEYVVDKVIDVLAKAEVLEEAAQAKYEELATVREAIKARIVIVE